MSRWINQFENHAFHDIWNSLKECLDGTTVDDETVITSVQELARLRKVIAFVNTMIASLDPELVPLTTWDNFNQQATPCYQSIVSYNSTRNIAHIQQANANADNLITYVRPYMVAEGKAGKLLQESVKQYAKTVEEFIGSFHEKSSEILSSIKHDQLAIESLKTNIENVDEKITQYKEKLFGNDEDEGIEHTIDALVEDAEAKREQIAKLHDELLVGDSKSQSIKALVIEAKDNVIEDQENIDKALNSVVDEVKGLTDFYIKIFGKLNDEDERVGGLSNEITLSMKTLRDFETQQKIKYDALVEQIETLLPGATSAGLATAYEEMKLSFNNPIKTFGRVFYGAVFLLVVVSLFSVFDSIGLNGVKFAQFVTWDAALKALLNKLPLYGALVWLAGFASSRRSESQRLQQEYAHKEALAKSYDKYKKQIEALGDEDNQMQKEFIKKAVDAIVYNASQTLDGRHGDNHPLHNLAGSVADKLMEKIPSLKKDVTKEGLS